MMINAAQIDWNNITKAIPAFLTISIMPLTYSISYGEGLPQIMTKVALDTTVAGRLTSLQTV